MKNPKMAQPKEPRSATACWGLPVATGAPQLGQVLALANFVPQFWQKFIAYFSLQSYNLGF